MRNFLLIIFVLHLLAACGADQPQLPRLSSDALILAFGDSLTFGTGSGKGKSYPEVLADLSGHRVINAGVPGEVTENGLQRLPALLDQHQPQLMILCHGGNDILRKKPMQSMSANLRNMIKLASERDIPVVLLAVPKFGLFLSAAPEYLEIAESTGVVYIGDLVPDILSDRDLKADTVHPNADGYRCMAENIHAVLRERGAL